MGLEIKPLDRVEILTLQDNYIDIAAGDGNEMIQRMFPLKDGELKNTILAEHGFSALITASTGDQTHGLLFDFGLSEFGAAFNADNLNADLTAMEAIAISHGHPDHTGGFKQLVQKKTERNPPGYPSRCLSTPSLRENHPGFQEFIFQLSPGKWFGRPVWIWWKPKDLIPCWKELFFF